MRAPLTVAAVSFLVCNVCFAESKESAIKLGYGKKGTEISTSDGRFLIQIQWRLQFRYSFPFEDDPQTIEEFDQQEESSFRVRRGRMKVGGHAYRPWLKYYLEYDFPSTNLLDWRFTLEKYDALQLRVGQWKANFNRERVASSGEQQFAERSIINDVFTIDRQEGIMVMGHILEGSPGDSWYHLGVFTGTGRGSSSNDDSEMMWLTRYQWNFLKRDLELAESDTEYHEKPAASVAAAAVRNRSPFTKFSSSGGSQLPGFEDGTIGQYSIVQWLFETALKYRGFSFQNENHWKKIEDHSNLKTTRLRGSYLQAGYFLHYLISAIPKPLEFAARWAYVDSDTSRPQDTRNEYTVGLNWFFKGHHNKLTLDASRLTLEQREQDRLQDDRIRLQWDVSF